MRISTIIISAASVAITVVWLATVAAATIEHHINRITVIEAGEAP